MYFNMNQSEILEQISLLKAQKKAIVLAHYYQLPEIQDIADYVGDSFALSKLAAGLPNNLIVFCGVNFMAESAKLLSPDKTILLPVMDADCPMANMAVATDVERMKADHPDAAVVSYVNSTTDVKAMSDICCTSANVIKVIRSLPHKKIIFLPDENLGSYAASLIPEKEFILFHGYCPPHEQIMEVEVRLARKYYPGALVLVHPECRQDVREQADFIGSTAQIINFASNSNHNRFIIGTETGILHSLRKQNPHKTFFPLSDGLYCPNMKKTTMVLLLLSLQKRVHQVEIDRKLMEAARLPLLRMLQVS